MRVKFFGGLIFFTKNCKFLNIFVIQQFDYSTYDLILIPNKNLVRKIEIRTVKFQILCFDKNREGNLKRMKKSLQQPKNIDNDCFSEYCKRKKGKKKKMRDKTYSRIYTICSSHVPNIGNTSSGVDVPIATSI